MAEQTQPVSSVCLIIISHIVIVFIACFHSNTHPQTRCSAWREGFLILLVYITGELYQTTLLFSSPHTMPLLSGHIVSSLVPSLIYIIILLDLLPQRGVKRSCVSYVITCYQLSVNSLTTHSPDLIIGPDHLHWIIIIIMRQFLKFIPTIMSHNLLIIRLVPGGTATRLAHHLVGNTCFFSCVCIIILHNYKHAYSNSI